MRRHPVRGCLCDVRLACPDMAPAYDLARTFHDLVSKRPGNLLPEWIQSG
ncbi:hypothetical protein ACFYWY_36510 [Streptomyces sp. NPDC002870]